MLLLVTTTAVSWVGNEVTEVVPGNVDTEVPEVGVVMVLRVMMDFDVVDGVIELIIHGPELPNLAVMIG